MESLNSQHATPRVSALSRKIYTVSEITRAIRTSLEEKFSQVWIEGEISGFKLHTSGHMYFRLKDKEAVMDAVMFRGMNQSLAFKPKDGVAVIVCGRISVYEKHGNYQIYVERMEPKGIGALQLAFEELKAKLDREGLFDPSRKRPIPRLPRKIGVVTSPTGAAIRDILKVLNRRFTNVHVLIHPVLVQGPEAAADIVQAIDTMNRIGSCDVLIVGRGGGSLEDLWAFNEEIVARAIARSKTPIISAVGHEIDFTIADFVADLRAPTPSVAAELVIPEKSVLEADVRSLRGRMENVIRNTLADFRGRLDNITSRYAFRQPRFYLEQLTQRLDDMLRHLVNQVKHALVEAKRDFKENLVHLEALNPLTILERGYSVTLDPDGRPLLSVRSVKLGEEITTRLFEGNLKSKVVLISEAKKGKSA